MYNRISRTKETKINTYMRENLDAIYCSSSSFCLEKTCWSNIRSIFVLFRCKPQYLYDTFYLDVRIRFQSFVVRDLLLHLSHTNQSISLDSKSIRLTNISFRLIRKSTSFCIVFLNICFFLIRTKRILFSESSWASIPTIRLDLQLKTNFLLFW